ncbi:sensor histidine kinase [Isoalcanivorax indicus]|uniref:sensor histidine kinase n=1 Tax=Isoalcanivorax indicus TaxID=2202653 RepID=UPI000DBABABB|nr:ATP-binding protein [Isoalcanivorax indicus]
MAAGGETVIMLRGGALCWGLALVLLSWCTPAAAAPGCTAAQLTQAGEFGVATLGAGLTRVSPELSPGSVEEVAALPESAFVPLPRSGVHVKNHETVWLRLCLQRSDTARRDWVLKLLPAYVAHVALHDVTNEGFRTRVRALTEGRNDSDIPYRGAAFLLSPAADSVTVYYLEITTPRLAIDLLLFEHTAMSRFVAAEYAGFGLYFGMMLLVVVINLFFWRGLKDPLYLRYALALLSTALFSLVVGGYLLQMVPAFAAWYYPTSRTLFAASAVFMTSFVLLAFRTRLYYPRLYQFGRVLIAAFIILGAAGAAGLQPGFDPVRAFRLLTVVAIVSFAGMMLHALFRHRSVRVYAIAFMPLVAGLLAVIARAFELLETVPLVDHLPNVGALVHLVLLNLVLAQRAGRTELRRRRAQEAALQAAQAAERALEARVRERTHDLDVANDRLRTEVAERTDAQGRLREALESERRALQSQRQFVAMLSHELRTPLAVIDSAAQGLAAEATPVDEPVHRRVSRIRRSVARLIGVIENLLADDRIASPSRLRLKYCDLRHILESRIAPSADERLNISLPDEAIPARVDPDLVGVVVANLVDNALKYAPADTPVALSLSREGDHAVITVRDQGPGVPPADVEKVFEKYYRAANEQTTAGSGLGLYVCREIVRHHGGDIALLPAQDGCGTVARLRLPLLGGGPQA